MQEYNPTEIEKKWQDKWEKDGIYHAKTGDTKKKWYSLIEFPYPSGAGLHTGHIRSFTAMDIVSRKRRMEGYNVLYPMGWDAFGLPTENYAIKTGIPPQQATKENVATFKRQMQSLGLGFDWSREVNTTDPSYYKWTQWIFLKFLEKGLAYKASATINWCLSCKIGLANEEVVGGVCERCGGEVTKKQKEQWLLKITAYADKLLEGLNEVDYLPEVKIQQQNWIGKSEGAEIDFKIKDFEKEIKVFTTRPETIFGATYVVLAPEHNLIHALEDKIENLVEVKEYLERTGKKNDLERTAEGKEKTGVELRGLVAINPANQKELPIWIADYILSTYGTGAVMAVPAHDERDSAFAKKYNLEILTEPLVSLEKALEVSGGKKTTTYKLRDWIFSRQRYWGEPIPVIHCEECGVVPVPEKDLPVVLPEVKNYQPREDGESPLASVEDWVNVSCPKCSGIAKRETDVMPNWAGSSWYFLRYTDPNNQNEFASKEAMSYFMPVDWYNGGMEHVTLHLLYSRFWNLFLYDLGLVPTKEPYKKRTKHGMILGPDGKKMSKSLGNVVNPDDLVQEFGADALRLYEMFMGPFDQMIPWDKRGILGPARFLEKIWRLSEKVSQAAIDTPAFLSILHKAIKKVGADIENLAFNTAVSQMMIFLNQASEEKSISEKSWQQFLGILAPFAPHITEELWFKLGEKNSIHLSSWPTHNEAFIQDETFELVIQINGKLRATVSAQKGISEEEAQALAKAQEKAADWLKDTQIKKVVFVKDRLINFII